MRRRKWDIWLLNKKALNKDFKIYKKKKIVRKIGEAPRISKIHIDKSYHNLDFANFVLKNQDKINRRVEDETYYDWVIVISYYAMYHSAMSLLYKIGYKADTHLATICVLCKECLGKGLDKEDIERLTNVLKITDQEIKEIGRVKERRERASYSGSISFEKNLAEITLDDAKKFINKIANILSE